jgi:hypothetical protein
MEERIDTSQRIPRRYGGGAERAMEKREPLGVSAADAGEARLPAMPDRW